MKQSKSILTRSLALALALVLMLTSVNLGTALRVFAAESDKTVGFAQLVADNYELTDAEKALLTSGNLVNGYFEYNVPADEDNLVEVDTGAKKITVKNFEGWTPVAAAIVVGDEVKETVALKDGVGEYAFDENAFSVKVTYTLTHEVEAAFQEKLLNAASNLKGAMAEAEAVYDGSDADLGVLVLALPTLMDLADGITFDMGITTKLLQLEEAGAAAVRELNAQLAGDNTLKLQEMNELYAVSISKLAFADQHGEEYLACIKDTLANVNAIKNDKVMTNDLVDAYLEAQGGEVWTNWQVLGAKLDSLSNVLGAVSAAWDTSAIAEGINPLALEEQLAAITTISANTVKNPLHVETVSVQKNLSMFNVAVSVKLEYVLDNEIVSYPVVETATVTLGKGATAEQILSAIEKAGIEDAAKAAWGEQYNAENFEKVVTALPETLTEDVSYDILYTPKTYTVTYGEGYNGAAAEQYPYGWMLTLPVHENPNAAYDYTFNGAAFEQGSEVYVMGDCEISRKAGKAYTVYTLYDLMVSNLEISDSLKAVLTSGAINGNKTFKIRVPEASEVDELIKLFEGKMELNMNYPSDFNNIYWAPYSYQDGNEAEVRIGGGDSIITGLKNKLVKVKYFMGTGYDEAKVASIINPIANLGVEAQTQIATLNRLVGHYGAMGSLDKIKLGALNGVIDVTDLHDDPAKNAALKAEFKTLVSGIIKNNLDGSTLKIYNILTEYQKETTGGLHYYYDNAEYVLNEISALSEYLNGMTDNDEKLAALEILTVAAGYPEYKESIQDLGRVMAEVKRDLTLPNKLINLESDKLYGLVETLTAWTEAEEVAPKNLIIVSPTLNAVDLSLVSVQVVVTANGKSETFAAGPFDRGTVLADSVVADLVAEATGFGIENIGATNMAFYSNNLDAINALAGKQLTERVETIYVNFNPINYTINIPGARPATVNVNKLSITLPENGKEGYTYEYSVFGKTVVTNDKAVTIALTLDNLASIENGVYDVTRKEIYKAAEDLENKFDDLFGTEPEATEPEATEPEATEPADPDAPTDPNAPTEPTKPVQPQKPAVPVMKLVKNAEGAIIGIDANVEPSMGGVMDFINKLISMGYSQIELNGEPLVQMVNDVTKMSLQTLMNALLNDKDFGSETIINLGKNNGGVLFTAKMNLGNETNARAIKYDFTDLVFTFKFQSVPAQMVQVANGLNAIKNYMTFKAVDGTLDINLNLPDKIYEAYLTAMMSCGELDSDNLYVNNEIAYQFLRDYLDIILYSDATAQSFQNSLDMLDDATAGKMPEADLLAYSAYYNAIKTALTGDGIVIEPHGEEDLTIDIAASGMTAINGLMGLVGMDPESMKIELALVKEYDKDAAPVSIHMTASLANTMEQSEAAILDVVTVAKSAADKNVRGVAQGLDFTSDLNARLQNVAGASIIVLLGDVKGDLVVNHGAIIDLNGHFILGDLKANAHTIVLDSTLASTECGGVKGKVSGKAHLIAGNYSHDVMNFVRDGYYQDENGAVVNCVFIAEKNGNDLTYVLNSDYMYCKDLSGYVPSITAIAADIALDMVSHKYLRAGLTVDGAELYKVDFSNLIALLDSDDMVHDLVDKVLGCFNKDGIKTYTKAIISDLLNWRELASNLSNDKVIGDHLITVNPWTIDVQYVAETDHVDFGIVANDKGTETTNLGIKIIGTNKDALIALAHELHDIVSVDVDVDLKKPTWNRTENIISLAGNTSTTVFVDLGASDRYSKYDYLTVLSVILANGNPGANADAMIKGLHYEGDNGIDIELMKSGFDKMTVQDLFDAMKALNKTDDFKKLANNVGLNMPIEEADRLENVYHLFVAAAGKILDVLHIDGMNKQLGNLDKDDDGIYVLTATRGGKVDATVKGYTGALNVEHVTVTLMVDIFGCMWGDVNHDFKINVTDAVLIMKHRAGTLPADQVFCEKKANVSGDNKINVTDATLVVKYRAKAINKFPVEAN